MGESARAYCLMSAKPAALMKDRLVLYRRPDGVGIYDVLNNAFREAGHAPQIAETVTRIIAAINLVAAGLGFTKTPLSNALNEMAKDTHGTSLRELASAIGWHIRPPLPLT